MEIKRRKTVSVTGKPGGANSASNSGGDDLGSTSTGSVDAAAVPTDLSCENEKLKIDNEKLSCELERAKKQCDELVAFLRETLDVGPDQINCMIRQGTNGSSHDVVVDECSGENLKLFGVWLNGEKGEKVIATPTKGNCRKRGREEPVGTVV